MKINSSSIGMDSARSYNAASYSYRRFELKDYSNVTSNLNGNTDRQFVGEKSADDAQSSATDSSKASGAESLWGSMNGISSLQEKMSRVINNYRFRTEEERSQETIRQESIKYILELLFGRTHERIKKWLEEHFSPDIGRGTGIGTYDTGIGANGTDAGDYGNAQVDALFTDYEGNVQQTGNLSFVRVKAYDLTQAEYRYESEDTTFSARGVVRTADGREISFNVDVGMSREFESYYEERTQLQLKAMGGINNAILCDPLVINLEGNVASVSDQKIRFDIDGDGELDTIGQLGSGSGYLALDKNNDGRINDGTELFGTASGDGFADLAKYDDDGNGWIDENDAVWAKLKVMTYDESGQERLYSLAQTGVGAICLSRVATDFSQKNENNDTQSVIRSTGIFLYESGHAGTVQHLDVAKYQMEA